MIVHDNCSAAHKTTAKANVSYSAAVQIGVKNEHALGSAGSGALAVKTKRFTRQW